MKKNFYFLLLLTLIGALLRFAFLGQNPIAPNWDEISHGYNAFSILTTGKDEWGNVFPLIFRAFGDYKLPLYIYLTTIPVFIFGLNVFAVRFVSALSGVLAIPAIYFLTKEMFPERKINLGKLTVSLEIVSAFLLTISPWHFFISRPALEANLALTLIIYGSYFLIRFYNRKSSALPTAIFFGLALHTYNTARVFTPLLIVVSLVIFRNSLSHFKKNLVKNTIALLLFGSLAFLVGLQVLSGEGSARYEKLKILSPSIVYQIGEKRANSHLPSLLARVIYNRPIYFISTVTKNYISYFSPSFIYQKWGAQYQFAIPGKNMLTLPVYLLAIVGFITIFKKLKGNKNNQFILSWFLLSPVAASLTIDPPQALRPNPMIPSFIILSSLGLFYVLDKSSKKYLSYIFLGLSIWIISSFSYYLYIYRNEYKIKYSSSWQYGYSQIINFVRDHSSEYDKIFITKRYGEPHIFYAFFTKLDPKLMQPGSENIRFQKSDWFWTDKIGKVYFINDWQIPTISVSALPLESGELVSTERSLLVTSPNHVPVNAHRIETISFLDGSPAFIITSVP